MEQILKLLLGENNGELVFFNLNEHQQADMYADIAVVIGQYIDIHKVLTEEADLVKFTKELNQKVLELFPWMQEEIESEFKEILEQMEKETVDC